MSGRRTIRLAVAAALVLAIGAWRPGGAAAQAAEVAPRKMAFAERGANLVVSTAFPELFDRASLAALSSGLPTTVVARVYVYRALDELPIALAVLRFDVVYDLWDEVYVARMQGALGSGQARHATRAAAVAAITTLAEVPVVALDRLPVGRHHVAAVVAELNPVSEERMAEMRRWLTRRPGDRLDAGTSFFGSFVSVFVNPRLEAADRIVRLRSQPFFKGPR